MGFPDHSFTSVIVFWFHKKWARGTFILTLLLSSRENWGVVRERIDQLWRRNIQPHAPVGCTAVVATWGLWTLVFLLLAWTVDGGEGQELLTPSRVGAPGRLWQSTTNLVTYTVAISALSSGGQKSKIKVSWDLSPSRLQQRVLPASSSSRGLRAFLGFWPPPSRLCLHFYLAFPCVSDT